MDWTWGFPPLGVFGFIIAIVFIGSLFNYLKAKSAHETIRDLASSAQPIDPELYKSLDAEGRAQNGSGMITGGAVTFVVGAAVFLGAIPFGTAVGDAEVTQIFQAMATMTALIGGGIFLVGLIKAMVLRAAAPKD